MSRTEATVPSAGPLLRGRLRANRGLILVGVGVMVVVVLLALAQSSRVRGLLDPRATDPSGSAALATLLAEQGVTVVPVTDTAAAVRAIEAAGGRATLLLAPTASVSPRMLDAISAAPTAYRVLLAPSPETLAALAPSVTQTGGRDSSDEIDPGCAWDVAARAGALPATGPTYNSSQAGGVSCWDGSVLELTDERTTTVVGAVGAFTNDKLDESGNAAMSMGVLGRSDTLVWWLPSALDPLAFPEEVEIGNSDLVPPWVRWAMLQIAVATLMVVWWRGRRLGRIVVEPLPVVVRATETVEGRARLYRRGHARGRAADALRSATTDRLRARLSLPRVAELTTVVATTATRTGRPATEIAALLTPGTLAPGNDPTDDAGLVRLAHALDTLENEVRRT